MKNFVRRLLWWIFRRDFLVLNPRWSVAGRGEGLALVGNDVLISTRYLPVAYNYHTPCDWLLTYDIRGNEAGLLRYSLAQPKGARFCEAELPVQLPFKLNVRLDGGKLMINDSPLPLLAGNSLPLGSPWLVASFEFDDSSGVRSIRHAGHRVRREPSEDVGKDYYAGAVYENYEEQAAKLPAQILDTIASFRPLTGRFLDIGCATGLLVEEASKRGLDAEGVDFSEWAIGEANKRTADRCRVMNLDVATALDFPVAYDIITMHSVIEHLADPQKVLDLLFQISRPGAVVYVQTLNADSMMHKIMETQWEGYTDFTHKSPWISRDWLTGASIKTGFEVVKVKTDGAWCENKHDEVWSAFKFVIQSYPSSLLLEEAWGDFLEVILRHPEDYGSESYNKP